MEKVLQLTAVIERERDGYVATCPELDVVSQGNTVEKAIKNLNEAVELYIEEFGVPKELFNEEFFITRFDVEYEKIAGSIRT